MSFFQKHWNLIDLTDLTNLTWDFWDFFVTIPKAYTLLDKTSIYCEILVQYSHITANKTAILFYISAKLWLHQEESVPVSFLLFLRLSHFTSRNETRHTMSTRYAQCWFCIFMHVWDVGLWLYFAPPYSAQQQQEFPHGAHMPLQQKPRHRICYIITMEKINLF